MFTLTSFSKQSASWKVLETCELCALSTDSLKTYSVNTLVAAATASTGGGNNPLGGGGGGGGGITEKTPIFFIREQRYSDKKIDVCACMGSATYAIDFN